MQGRVVAAALALALVLVGAGTKAQLCAAAEPPAANTSGVPVSTAPAERQSIARALEFVGRVEAPERVDIRAQVKSMLDAVLFKDGDTVAEGAPLYRIDKSLFQAAVTEAEGELERSKAALELAEVQRQRAEDLLARNSGTVVSRDQAVAVENQSKAAVTAAEANLDTAKINLGYTDINAPISGRIGRTTVTRGNIVGPESGVLAVMVSQDPMHITFPVSQREFLAAQKADRSADLKSVKVQIAFSDGTVYPEFGQITFIDVSVDRTTDTQIVRADMANPKRVLTDGQLVRVKLEVGAPEERVVVPQSALIADQEGLYVFVVEDGKAVIRRVKAAGESGPNTVIASGLDGGEQVIVEGFQTLRPGLAVRASPFVGLKSGG
jgi:membrane fusion protein (multidrug efflux system)